MFEKVEKIVNYNPGLISKEIESLESETDKYNLKVREENKRLENKTKNYCFIAIAIGICLATACTKNVVPSFFLTGYGIIMIFSGLFVVLFSEKYQLKEKSVEYTTAMKFYLTVKDSEKIKAEIWSFSAQKGFYDVYIEAVAQDQSKSTIILPFEIVKEKGIIDPVLDVVNEKVYIEGC